VADEPLMRESDLLQAVREAARWLGLRPYHTHDSRRSEPGFPDLVIVGPGGVLFREVKTARGRVTPDQRRWLDALSAAGADAGVWRPGDWPLGVLADLRRVSCRARRDAEGGR